MKSQTIYKEYNEELIRFMKQLKANPKSFVVVPTLENIIIYLDGFAHGLIGQLVKLADENEFIFYKTPDSLVKEYLVASYLIPESKKSQVVNPNLSMIAYFKNKYQGVLNQVDQFLDIAIKCYTFELSKDIPQVS